MNEDEQCGVQDLVTYTREFDSYPFDPASLTLCNLQPAIPASGELIADFNSCCWEEKLTNFLKDRVFSKKTSIHGCVSLSKCIAFANQHHTDSVREDPKSKSY